MGIITLTQNYYSMLVDGFGHKNKPTTLPVSKGTKTHKPIITADSTLLLTPKSVARTVKARGIMLTDTFLLILFDSHTDGIKHSTTAIAE